MKLFSKTSIMLSLFLLASCLSTNTTSIYQAGSSYRGFSGANMVKSSEQSMVLNGEYDTPKSTYDDEFVYDADGNLIKHTQTEYIHDSDGSEKYIVWEISYNTIGGQVVPGEMSVNGTTFAKLEYEILAIEGSGIIRPWAEEPSFQSVESDPLSGAIYSAKSWTISPSAYYLGFKVDGKFVEGRTGYSEYYGFYDIPSISLGWNNIVLNNFFYSYEELINGIALSYDSDDPDSEKLKEMVEGSVVTIDYEWDLIAGNITLVALACDAKINEDEFEFYIDRDFNSSGQLLEEVWKVSDPELERRSPGGQILFKQIFTY